MEIKTRKISQNTQSVALVADGTVIDLGFLSKSESTALAIMLLQGASDLLDGCDKLSASRVCDYLIETLEGQ